MLAVLTLTIALASCSNAPAPGPTQPAAPTAPSVALPADMPPLKCADFEPPPVKKPAEKFTGRRCTGPDGSTRWIHSFYQCADGRIWPILMVEQPTGANGPAEPTNPAFDRCLGRS